jgi:predicted ribosomally synthesized peptide with nif11-like leader
MSVKNAQEFIKKIRTDRDFVVRCQNANENERKELIRAAGFDFTKKELDAAMVDIVGGIYLTYGDKGMDEAVKLTLLVDSLKIS